LTLLLFAFAVGGSIVGALPGAAALSPDATITVNAARPDRMITGDLWGSNLLQYAPASMTVNHAGFVDAARQMGLRLIRWPGGNNADAYDWKRDEQIEPGRLLQNPNDVDILRMIQFTRDIGAEPMITVNFGSMSAQDAADLVEFLNGPVDSPWGEKRAARGFPDPLNVRFFEIGNEIHHLHMWYFSWTAQNSEKYFFGGEEERRGFYGGTKHDPLGAKGDFFRADGGPNQTYTLRFPPVRDVRVFWAATREEAENHIYEEWTEVTDLSTQPPDARVFTLDAEAGTLRFGDGVHGAMPPAGSFFLVEYTTYGHQGFVDFARAMRAAPSSVPIQVGAVMLPFTDDGQPLFDEARMRQVLAEMDFNVRHQYNASFPYDTYAYRRQMATERVNGLHQGVLRQYLDEIGMDKEIGVAVTEWNIFLDERYRHINRTLEGGVIAAEWFIRVLNAWADARVVNAAQFRLSRDDLSLIRTATNYAIAPMGYVFQGFAGWPGSRLLPTRVDSRGAGARAYNRLIPYVVATAALSPDGRTLRIAAVNNAESTPLTAALQITGFTAASGRLWRLAADTYDADNDRNPTNVVLREEPAQVPLTELSLPAHSVTFVELQGTSQAACVQDVNRNGVGDVVDIQATAAEVDCRVYLPSVAAQWRRPWPAPTMRYPRLHANLFDRVPEDEAAYDALSRYGAVTTGSIYSNGREGGSTWVSARALARGRIPPTT